MPNANRASGFSPVRYLNGSPWNGAANLYSIAAAYNVELAIGDPVISAGSASSKGLATIALAAVTGGVRGVIIGLGRGEGLLANPNNLDSTKRAAADGREWFALVVDDPNVIFEIQEESSGTALAATEVGLNTSPRLATAGTYMSAWLLRSFTGENPVVTATLQLKLLGLSQKTDNEFGAFAKWLVKFNVHELGTGTGALGV